ncbi:5-dehydro-4-deoxy-D-glucuronate isomerase [Pseudalkalibacillus salsuginis]|uniref:5-dehydro-4-deoxy-D-glucuronate isomerase n=1 Tax=Pseudalkalibacillus salsuginis TaxID=2910972 RepID=UPI001F461DFA|nr:5-dehydro-4-deoxy-D-glucuronate isomerase [Pseudalkalibacillus salsuginis]MCF6409987.1 5-dehydro-4-deoxy-D-glucuronate isomerase [Pseudalkalibacillus salsuginis]
MDIRYATNPEETKHYTTEKQRKEFLIEGLFIPGDMHLTYTHHDRVIIGGVCPTENTLHLNAGDTLKTDYFLERREIGIINIGERGTVIVEGDNYELEQKDCLYIGLGNKEVKFKSENDGKPAKFYLVSSLAHKEYPVQKLTINRAEPVHLGSIEESNERTIYKYIHADGLQSCQLMMGMTLLKPNNMWNTMPAHLHDRRMEAYLYFNMPEKGRVFHFMGEPNETRHLVVSNEQAVISPSWSIHSGCGTSNYTFIWAMAGENYTFIDMEAVEMSKLR